MNQQTARTPRCVLILTPSSRLLGARRSLLTLAEGLDPQRWRPVVCGQSHGELGEALAQRGIPMEVVKLGWWRKAKYFLWRPFAIARLSSLATRLKADLIHCNEIYPNPYAVRAVQNVPAPPGSPCEGKPIPVVTHIRLGMKENMIRKYDLARAEQLVVPSESVGHEFDLWEDKGERVRVVYNGVNMREYQRSRAPEAARLQIGVPNDGPLLAAIGQLGPRKGGDVLLEAFARVLARRPSLRLMFVGNPHRSQAAFATQLKARCATAPLAQRVHFFPFTTQIRPYYEAADVNVLVSRDEAFGRTIIEAAAMGVPTIGARIGGIAEIVVDGETGRLVPPEDPEALAQAIEQLVSNDALRRAMGESAFRLVAQKFSSASHIQQMMDLYDEVLERKAATS